MAIDAEAWIDPDVVEKAGISAEELHRYKNPEPFEGEAAPLRNRRSIRRSRTWPTRPTATPS
ncbi:MAG: hypothetical protein R2710_20730 [Acidimicrobiales bacterium]